MDRRNIQQLEADLRAKLTSRLVNFTDTFGGDVFGFATDVQVQIGKDGEPEVSVTINGRRHTISHSWLTTTLKVF